MQFQILDQNYQLKQKVFCSIHMYIFYSFEMVKKREMETIRLFMPFQCLTHFEFTFECRHSSSPPRPKDALISRRSMSFNTEGSVSSPSQEMMPYIASSHSNHQNDQILSSSLEFSSRKAAVRSLLGRSRTFVARHAQDSYVRHIEEKNYQKKMFIR